MAKMETGPFVSVAVFCDSAVVGEDKALSIIRIIDTVMQNTAGPEPPEDMPPFMLRTKLVLSLKAGRAKGRFNLKIRPEAPDGRQLEAQGQSVHLEGGYSGVNIITDVQLGVDLEGIYWFDILFERTRGEDVLLTRVPLRIQYQPQRTPAG